MSASSDRARRLAARCRGKGPKYEAIADLLDGLAGEVEELEERRHFWQAVYVEALRDIDRRAAVLRGVGTGEG